jgi:hypothetical protein
MGNSEKSSNFYVIEKIAIQRSGKRTLADAIKWGIVRKAQILCYRKDCNTKEWNEDTRRCD